MKAFYRLPVSLTLVCAILLGMMPFALAAPVELTPDQTQKVETLVESFANAYRAKDLGALEALSDKKKDADSLARAGFTMLFNRIFNDEMGDATFDAVESSVSENRLIGDCIVTRVAFDETIRTADGTTSKNERRWILNLVERDGELKIDEAVEEILGGSFNPQTRAFASEKGHYSVTIPDGWTPVHAPPILGGIVPDSFAAVAPDLESFVLLGFVQMPLKVSAQQAVEADAAGLQRMAKDYVREGGSEVEVAGMPGYQLFSEFALKEDSPGFALEEDSSGRRHRREQLYFAKDDILYFLVFDALPPEQFDTLKPAVDAMMDSFAFAASEEGLSPQQKVAEELGQGSVTGRTYTNEEFNCFIAAPEGWEIDTSPNPGHLVQMKHKGDNSIARLLGADLKDRSPKIPPLKDAVEVRLKQVEAVVQDFKEVSRRDTTVQGVPAIESVQTYSLEGLGKFEIKELTVIRDGIYYLILCQAVGPQTLEQLGPDFDRIIRSFGFVK
ncbi:hypothetical protein JW916_00025 [Candidatus Sumerlaeota bacterium]|nr:hypothetical protein [Candidatus Sumerlaeota bacterium]